MTDGARAKKNANDHCELLNGRRPKADARLINDILHNEDTLDECDPSPPNVETCLTNRPLQRGSHTSSSIEPTSTTPGDCRKTAVRPGSAQTYANTNK